MKEYPLIFKGFSIRALLDGSKSQTRRIPTCANSLVDGDRVSSKTWKWYDWDWPNVYIDPGPSIGGYPYSFFKVPSKSQGTRHRIYPIWEVGDRIWCKETWAPTDRALNVEPGAVYRATDPDWGTMEGWKWRPSIFMPRWASRISLTVKEVRCERVGDISEEDAYAEGISGGDSMGDPVGEFAKLWDSINLKRGYPFADSPPVYVLGLGRMKT